MTATSLKPPFKAIQRAACTVFLFLAHAGIAGTDGRELSRVSMEADTLNAQAQAHLLRLKAELNEEQDRKVPPFMCQGRLTLSSGEPVTTADVSNATTVYFTPYRGSYVALHDGTAWRFHKFSELSLTLSGLTSNTNYDIFIYENAGAPTLELGPAWTSNTARSAGGAISLLESVYVLTSDNTRRYLGTMRATSATQTQDTQTQRFLWNMYNRVERPTGFIESTDSWNYGTGAFRSTNNSTANRIEVVIGLDEVSVHLRGMVLVTTSAGTNRNNVSSSFGQDTTTGSVTLMLRGGAARSVISQQLWSELTDDAASLGYHFFQWIEYGVTDTVFYGDGGDARLQSGVMGWVHG